MARLPYLRYDDAPDHIRAALEAYPEHVRAKNVWGVLSHAEGVLLPMIEYGRALATRTEIPAALRECAVMRVAWLTPGTDYIWNEHVPIARALGLDDKQIAALSAEQPDPADLGADAALVVRFTDQFYADATADDDVWAAMTARFTPREIVELIMATGHFMMFARLHATVGTDLDDDAGAPPPDPAFFGAARTDA
jgi:alkylhydroperoxidase family enzyme